MRFNQLSDEQEEILDILQEECAEVIQAIAKIKRHGYTSFHPDHPNGPTNFDHLIQEMGDLKCIAEIWKKTVYDGAQFIIEAKIEAASLAKLDKLPRYTHHIDWSRLK